MRHEEMPAALAIQPRRDLARAEAVAVRLDHAGDGARRVVGAQQAPVGGDRVEVDFQAGGAQSCPAWCKSRSANRVNSASKNSWSVPVGPWRCLAMMRSAWLCTFSISRCHFSSASWNFSSESNAICL